MSKHAYIDHVHYDMLMGDNQVVNTCPGGQKNVLSLLGVNHVCTCVVSMQINQLLGIILEYHGDCSVSAGYPLGKYQL